MKKKDKGDIKGGDNNSDVESEEEREYNERTKLLKTKSAPLRCPICGSAQAYLIQMEGVIVCRKGHKTWPTGVVDFNGTMTSLEELRDRGVGYFGGKLYCDVEKEEEGL